MQQAGFHGKVSGFITGDITTTLAAQIGTLPIMLGTFGNYGVLSILVNALVLWTVPVVMTAGSLAVLAGFIFAPLSKIFLYPAYPFLFFFQEVVSFFGRSNVQISIQNVPVEIWLGYYFLMLAVIVWFSMHKSKTAIEERDSASE